MYFPQYYYKICQSNRNVIGYTLLTVLYYLYAVASCSLSNVLISTLCVQCCNMC